MNIDDDSVNDANIDEVKKCNCECDTIESMEVSLWKSFQTSNSHHSMDNSKYDNLNIAHIGCMIGPRLNFDPD